MIYLIKIDFEEFDVNKVSEIRRMFSYCQEKFGFKGERWEEVKLDCDYESLGIMLEAIGVDYQEYIE
ncbi:hypothetical protein [Bacillus xiapuensis]|uniref:Uncharacterized protein n=1 Tax=Bacillus xiapuensis TaxID=2014075 RepID=A0ABU6N7W8_9BACI|nr:hypothetical protein [Bacillus xiapuensis]